MVRVIDTEAVPLLKRCSLAGHAELKTRNPIFGEHPLAADMFIDVLTDRGFSVAHVVDEQIVPVGNPGLFGCHLACVIADVSGDFHLPNVESLLKRGVDLDRCQGAQCKAHKDASQSRENHAVPGKHAHAQ